jgi:gamma-glutamyltranspeptidase/glutathione hydrolase
VTRFLIPACLLSAIMIADLEGAERPAPTPYKVGRSVVMAPHGMVATSHPLAAEVGLDVLKHGGNAIDAAIAANAAIGLMEPMSCGIGGDLYAIVWDAKTQKLYGLNASGRAPFKTSRKLFADRGLADIPTSGPLSWSVPGCVDGWDQLRQRFGTMTFKQLLEPTIRYAEDGFPVTEVIAGYWRASEKTLLRDPDSARAFLIESGGQRRAPRAGEVFKNPALASVYREIAAGGRDAYYKGRAAAKLVEFSNNHGGLFSEKDFTEHTSTWVEPVGTTYRGYDVWELPPPGQGIAALQMLNVLEGFDLKKMGPYSPDYWHTLIEAKKLAFADRARFYADPAFAKVPVAELVGKPYADARRKLIDPARALTDVPAGDPKLMHGDTIYLCTVDKDRNCVSLIQSNYNGFGSGLAPAEIGFAIQNRGTLFALDENHPNRLEPGKRPFHTIIPAMVTKGGKPWLVFGVMGGDMQPQGHVEVLVNMIDFGMNVQQAGEAPRVEHKGSATPKGRPGAADGGTVEAETGMAQSIIDELTKRGHHVKMVWTNGGGYQAIMIDPATNVLHGGSEPRKDGCATGY